jgi:glucose-1-phosphate thymidylyltransferase
VILAAGYGTRLYPLTLRVPKALLPINDKPLINFLIEKIKILKKYFSIKEIIVVSNNKFYKKFLLWKDKYKTDVRIINDGSNSPEDRLGAIRDIAYTIGKKKGDWLILGADNIFEDNLIDFINFSYKFKPQPCLALYDVKKRTVASRFGVVGMNSKKRVTFLVEKPKRPNSTLIATCIYFFPEESLKFLYQFISQYDNVDAAGKYIEWLVMKTKVYGYLLKGKWIDIGHIDSLKLAQKLFK